MTSTPSETLEDLCTRVQTILPEQFRKDAWYLIVTAVLVGCNKSTETGTLYTNLVEHVSESEEKRIKARLSDVLMKEWTLVGVTPIVYAVTALGKAETAFYEKRGLKMEEAPPSEDGLLDFPDKRKNIDFNNHIPDRGTKFLQQLYRQNLAPICASWGSFASDFMWMERSVIYGLFLSDHEILSAVEAELVILTGIMIQGLSAPTIWHLRGLRRLGVSEEDTEKVQLAIEAVAGWSGRDVEGWPRVKDIGDI
ncbi:hypothetical protein EYB25_004153 [Talaromyces marneffei]|uniref:Carboxymuconolactone decarboxylase-like domain-containing protein n=2 Tax=Talaromyces marneffei TaxID=37727 RepID=B6QD44_TALMQ|nr:uncharacterized protein EYB26_004760 [Talaromyces marneffei]EEA24742.1 conserved hypothetical protein [Talaromyces marneffei ATCC 18224]KAE8552774.1 hypothetical protein EYB25_004153 [Talaromyces marneffei]QGA17090.1 hypothetical protein EYB26_004760 [Talaromyces marneffei]